MRSYCRTPPQSGAVACAETDLGSRFLGSCIAIWKWKVLPGCATLHIHNTSLRLAISTVILTLRGTLVTFDIPPGSLYERVKVLKISVFLVSLTNNSNDYTGINHWRLINLRGAWGGLQSFTPTMTRSRESQLLHFIQCSASSRPMPFSFEPQVERRFRKLRAPQCGGYGCVVLTMKAVILANSGKPLLFQFFSISSDHKEWGDSGESFARAIAAGRIHAVHPRVRPTVHRAGANA